MSGCGFCITRETWNNSLGRRTPSTLPLTRKTVLFCEKTDVKEMQRDCCIHLTPAAPPLFVIDSREPV
jgi:hypothetical protein